MTESTLLFLEDLVVGAEYRSAEHALSTQEILDFANQFDPQPFHLDEQAAQNSLFQGLAASGWHTAAITMNLLVQSLPLGSGIIGAGCTMDWPRPTRPGDTLHVISKIVEILPSRSKSDRGIVTAECRTLNQHGDVCLNMVPRLVVMRRPGQ